MARVPPYSRTSVPVSPTGLSPAMARLSRRFRYQRSQATGLVRVRSPLLAESRLMSFPPATEMFQFAGFASRTYEFSTGYRLRGGLPHSEIPGSTIARISPGLFAACHVLHRLSVPRHPPDALRLRLSATPNGKTTIARISGIRISQIQQPRVRQTLSRQKTPRGIHEDTSDTPRALRPRRRSPAYGHTTRFFTICRQQRPRPPGYRDPTGAILPLRAASWRRDRGASPI